MTTDSLGRPLLVVIDGPAGAGKTTAARRLAQALALPLLDTGAIYRTLALAAQRRGVAWDDEAGLVALADGLPIQFSMGDAASQRVLYDGDDVTAAIRTTDISQGASKVSALPGVRRALLGIQRSLGAVGCVAEGRDMGTVVFPDAPFKFFFVADLSERARRRLAEMGPGAETLDAVQAAMASRDARDSSREAAPLTKAADAIEVDTGVLSADAVLHLLLSHVRPTGG